MSTRTPAEVFCPGEFIREELEERGWTQSDLARILGRPLPTLNQIITGKKSITPATARELAVAFGTSPEFWLNLEVAYRLSIASDPDDGIRRRARLYDIAPVKDMERRHWIRRTSSAEELEEELRGFFGVESLDQPPHMRLAGRMRTASDEEMTAAQTAWCHRAARLASSVQAARFCQTKFERGCAKLQSLVAFPEQAREVPRVLAEMGIRFVVIQHLPKTKTDGAVLWIGGNEESPVIALSMRYDRIDWFWHTLSHELSHVRHQDGYVLDTDLFAAARGQGESLPEIERRADREAADFLIRKPALDSFVMRVRPLYSKARIIQFANRNRIHPGIVVGQLQYRGEIGYSANREMLVSVREQLTQAAMTDGWGKMVSLDM